MVRKIAVRRAAQVSAGYVPCPPMAAHRDPRVLGHSLCPQVLYNNKGYHSMPTYLNSLNNAILRANLPKSKGNPAAYGEWDGHARVWEGCVTASMPLRLPSLCHRHHCH